MVSLIKKYTIMIIDDEVLVARSISRFFKEEQYECFIIDDPEEVVQNVKAKHPDVIIMDVQMPRKSGFDLLKEIREFDKKTPVIMVSGNLDSSKVEALKKLGATECFEKPLSPTQFAIAVNRYLRIN